MRVFLLTICFSGLLFGGVQLFNAVSYIFFTPLNNDSVTWPRDMKQLPDGGRLNVLLLGLDDPEKDETSRRSDSILLASFDRPNQKVAVLSVPRDTLAHIPQRDTWEKINHAYAYGGAALARQTLSNFLNIPIHFHLTVDNASFKKIIDALGGVSLHVENDMNYEDPWQDLRIHIKRGSQYMDGETSVNYVRFRNDELGDVGRVLRQQQFLKALAGKVFSLDGLSRLPALQPQLRQMVDTDLTLPFVLRLLRSFPRYDKDGVQFETLPGEFATIDDISYWETDSQDVEELLVKMGIRPPSTQAER